MAALDWTVANSRDGIHTFTSESAAALYALQNAATDGGMTVTAPDGREWLILRRRWDVKVTLSMEV